MPLAVAAAGALLNTEKLSVPGYLALLEAEPVRPLPPDHSLRAYPEAVVKAWHLSIDRLERRSAAAVRLLEISSVMVPEISFDLIYSEPMVGIVRDLDPTISEPAMVAKLVTQIDDQALIKVDRGARQIQVHRVFQTIMQERMSPGQLDSARRNVHSLLVAARPKGDVDDPQKWQGFRLLWPHVRPSQAERSAGRMSATCWSTGSVISGSATTWAPAADARSTSRMPGRRCWRPSRIRTPPTPGCCGNSFTGSGSTWRTSCATSGSSSSPGSWTRLLREAGRAGVAHPHTLQTRSSLAADLRAQGKYREAQELDQATYESWALNSGFGKDYGGTLSAANNLALSNLLNGRYRDALRRDRLTLKRRTGLYGAGPADAGLRDGRRPRPDRRREVPGSGEPTGGRGDAVPSVARG